MPFTRRVTISLALATAGLSCASAGSGPLEGAASGGRPDLGAASSGTVLQLGQEEASRRIDVSAPVERAWAALPQVYGDLQIPGEVLDERSRTYGVRRFNGRRIGGRRSEDYVRCAFQGAGASAVSGYRVQLSIVSRVERSSDLNSTVATHVSGSASTIEGTSTEPVRCVSTGALEQRVAGLLSDRVR